MYQSFSAREPVEYILCPYLLKEFRNRWFLFGSKATNLQLYNLALDRIVSVEPSEVPFRENPDFDPEHFFDDVVGVSKNINNTPRKIIFWANREQSKYIQTKPIHPSQKIIQENKEDGSCTFSINVVINFDVLRLHVVRTRHSDSSATECQRIHAGQIEASGEHV